MVGQTLGNHGDRRHHRHCVRRDSPPWRVQPGNRPDGTSEQRGHDLATVDAAGLTTRELNARLKELAGRSGEEEITILNPQARHNIAVGIFDRCKIKINGSVGYFAASLLDGPDVAIDGNAGWALGDNMMSGKISLTKDAGESVASTMRGGELFVGGNAGARAGISMKGGTLIVGGNSGFLTGFMMQKGRIIVCGDVGEAVGDSMYEGTIYVGGEIASLGSDAKTEEISEDEVIDILAALENHGITKRYTFTKVVSAKRLYNYDSLERLEKAII
ncbi:MAG TPA: hypothetical protein EYM65_05965 [Dehalococcoidia bacterium]|nr:hypothetical protein [Dehalococcoidia bacterium]